MKKFISLFLFFTIYTFIYSQNTETKSDASYTFEIPEGWEEHFNPVIKRNIIYGEERDGFRQNIIVIGETYKGSLNEYIIKTRAALQAALDNYKIIKDEQFKTDTDIESWKLVIEMEYENTTFRQFSYIHKKQNAIFVCNCSALSDESTEMEDVFDKSMKTFSIESL